MSKPNDGKTLKATDYSGFVRALFADAELVRARLSELSDHEIDMLHATLGLSGEAGELLDAVKKRVIYGKPLDIDNVVEEVGDIIFYLQAFQNALSTLQNREGLEPRDPLLENISKLLRRYPGGEYSDAAAIARADKSASA